MNILIQSFDRDAEFACETIARLNASGHAAYVTYAQETSLGGRFLKTLLAVEERYLRINRNAAAMPPPENFRADLIVDLTGEAQSEDTAVLRVEINGHRNILDGLASVKTKTRHATVVAWLDDRPVARASPMISRQTFFVVNRDELFVGVQSLIMHTIARLGAGPLDALSIDRMPKVSTCFICAYIAHLATALCGRLLRVFIGRRCRWPVWQTAWRFIEGPGVAETRRLDGTPFSVLPDDGQRFYADPFVLEHQGETYIFVEEFPYATGKGVISVSKVGKDGCASVPRQVLEEQHHLSYPNVFKNKGEIFMVPESGAALEVVLYRAERFPDRWARHALLIAGHNINDATFMQRDGRLWMFATERFGKGSASDTMVVFSALDLLGPWVPHKLNPILIDKAGSRPGGHIIENDGRFFLPVQDGSEVYGGGLGLREIIVVDDDNVVLGPVEAIGTGSAWTRRGIHTLNRTDHLEVVDTTWRD